MSFSEAELEEQLKEVGNKLLDPPPSVDELLYLLDKTEHLLINVEQAPSRIMQDALLPPMKALISKTLLRHSDSKVKISVACCLSEITRITAPDAPYNDEHMKEIFQLVIEAFGKLTNVSGHDYGKAVSILETVAKIRSCLVMLDLELEDLVLEMFHLFLRVISYDHPPNVYVAMETIMTLVISEVEEISLDLLLVLLSSVRKSVQDQSTRAWMLGTKVMTNCSAKIKPYLQEAVQLGYVVLDEYGLIVSSICQEECNGSGYNTDVENNNEQKRSGTAKQLKGESETSAKKRGRKPNSLRNPEEGYEHSWVTNKQKSGQQQGKKSADSAVSEKGDNSGKKHGRSLMKKGHLKRKEEAVKAEPGDFLLPAGVSAMDRGSVSDDASLGKISKEKHESEGKMKKHALKQNIDKMQKPAKDAKSNDNHTSVDEHISAPGGEKNLKSLKKHTNSAGELPKIEGKRKRRMKKNTTEVPDMGEQLIGRRIKVWWPMDKTYYEGIVDAYDRAKKRHTVLYTDGDQEVLNLRKQRWELIGNHSLLKNQEAMVSKSKRPDEYVPATKKRRRSKIGADDKLEISKGSGKSLREMVEDTSDESHGSRRKANAVDAKEATPESAKHESDGRLSPPKIGAVGGDDVSAKIAEKFTTD